MARVFISSTMVDFGEARRAVLVAVRRLGHESLALEDWVSSTIAAAALDRSLDEVRRSDLFVCLVGWRYGHIPPGHDKSTVELQLNAARDAGIPCLVVLLREDSHAALTDIDDDPQAIRSFRERLTRDFIVSFFDNSKDLASRVATAIHVWTSQGGPGTPIVPAIGEVSTDPIGPEVFLSYAHEDLQTAEEIAARLARERWSVFWDRQIPVGTTWDDIVEVALDSAKCVVVLWSGSSRDSEWVRIEANEGAERGILAPALISQIKIPLRFRRIQAANLVGWSPAAGETKGMQSLLQAVLRCLKT